MLLHLQVVWLVIYPHDADLAQRTGDPTGIARDLSLTSLGMHGANVVFMLLEFSFDAMRVSTSTRVREEACCKFEIIVYGAE